MPDELANAPASPPSSAERREPVTSEVSREELLQLLERAVPGAEDLDHKLKAVFELSDESSSVRLR